ncbi:hypothetical protein, partial [Pseudomonas mandelii]|uniref:hypothetical protein n=1 Tax=Pseudomonas mandelii TaxID=75612 RepID=UPI003CFCFA39
MGQFFIILGLVVGQAPNTTPLQKNQLAAPLAVLFLLCSEVELRRYLFSELFPQLKNVQITHAWG